MTFMTTNPDRYLALKNAADLRRMKSVERTINTRSLFFIPKRALRRLEDRIRDGDLIAITTNREGLDVQHVGLSARMKNRIHLLHASSTEGKVVLSQKTLYRYLMESRARSGIMVARVFEAANFNDALNRQVVVLPKIYQAVLFYVLWAYMRSHLHVTFVKCLGTEI